MAIQNRRGAYSDFDPTKMLSGEFAIFLEGHPDVSDGKTACIAFSSGDVKRLMTFEDAEADIEEATEQAIAAIMAVIEDYKEDAEAWAIGKRDGTDVPSTDDTYHNNSKYYSEQSSGSATNSANSALAASGSATAASNSATLAESYAKGGTSTRTGEDTDNALYYKNQAAQSATDAAASAAHLVIDSALSDSSENAVQNKIVKGAIDGKQDTLTFDNSPTASSNNPVKSGGIKTAIEEVKCVVATSASFSSLPHTIPESGTNAKITSNHVVVNWYLSNPSAQTGEWTATTSDGSVTISGTISGSTTVTLYMIPEQT